jgi:hypothetical protein
MSYDLYLENDKGESLCESTNYTSNMYEAFQVAFGDPDGIYKLHGKTGAEAKELLAKAVSTMLEKCEEIEKLNPENGWGRHDRAAAWLLGFGFECANHPEGIVRLCA